MSIRSGSMRAIGVAAVLTLTVLAACATPSGQRHAAVPEPCADALYVQLKQHHPDSLSEREWQRLQSLDRECAAATAREAEPGLRGWPALRMRHGAAVGAGIMTVLMVFMMIRR